MPHAEQQNVAIFWDYENCHGPSSVSGYDIVKSIRCIAHTFGSVKLFKAYFELSEQSMTSRSFSLRSELQSSGVSLTDCPHNGRKNVADQMIMVDMLAYAMDTPAPSTIILISGDRDFAYAVSILRLRRYRVVVISLSVPGAHPSLKAQASVYLDWNNHVMGKIETGSHNDSSASHADHSPQTSTSNNSDIVSDVLLAPLSSSHPKFKPARVVQRESVTGFPQSRSKSQPSRDLRPETADVVQTELGAISCNSDDYELSKDDCFQEPVHVEGMQMSQGVTTGIPNNRLPVLGKSPSGNTQNHNVTVPTQPATTVPIHQEYSHMLQAPPLAPIPISGMSNNPLPNTQTSVQPTSGTSLAPQQGTRASLNETRLKTVDTQVSGPPLSGGVLLGKPPPMDTLRGPYSMAISSERPQSAPASAGPWSQQLGNKTLLADPAEKAQTQVLNRAQSTEEATSPTISQSGTITSESTVVPPLPDTGTTLQASAKHDEKKAVQTSCTVETSKQAITVAPSPKVVPPQFKLLISTLQAYHSKGITRPSRSIVATNLVAGDKSVYRHAGTERFAQYTALALKAGIIELGGKEANAWIALHPDWHGSVV